MPRKQILLPLAILCLGTVFTALIQGQYGDYSSIRVLPLKQAHHRLVELLGKNNELQAIGKRLEHIENALIETQIPYTEAAAALQDLSHRMAAINPELQDTELLFVERQQYRPDHHNTATIFQKGEINQDSFDPGAALKAVNITTGKTRTLLRTETGVIRDPEMSYDGKKIIFAYRKNKDDDYHIYEINTDGKGLKQLTWQKGVSDIDPTYLPDGNIIFSATREPKFCMCNRHIMANLYRMEADGANITQMGKSTLFEGHSAVMPDGRILYDRWEYVDRNFGDAQGLWTMNPDGTNHAIYYGNNLNSPGGVIDARPIPNTNKVICILGSCHDRPWGAISILDRSKGIDSKESVLLTYPPQAKKLVGKGYWDTFMQLPTRYEDPYALSEDYFLASKKIDLENPEEGKPNYVMAIVLLDKFGNESIIHQGEAHSFDPMPIRARTQERKLPDNRDYSEANGTFYIQNVYEGTHLEGVKPGAVKYLRVIESPEKRSWTYGSWNGQGQQAPGVNWSSFENKRILGEVPVEEDGSVYFELPSKTYVYFQILDKDKKMIQSMRSGTMVQPNEHTGCIGCHEDRLSVPPVQSKQPIALRRAPSKLNGWKGKSRKFSYMEEVQPVFDKHCVECHDFDKEAGKTLNLSRDRNPYFNASYLDLYTKKMVNLVGGGPSDLLPAYSWGSHNSKLTTVIDSSHYNVKLSKNEKERLYTWMDINGVYYPDYECAYPNNPVGRSPLSQAELDQLGKYTGVNFGALAGMHRRLGAQISFERPELSPCLNELDEKSSNYKEAINLIKLGSNRLKETPRADMENFVPAPVHQCMMHKYEEQRAFEKERNEAISKGKKLYDSYEYRQNNSCLNMH